MGEVLGSRSDEQLTSNGMLCGEIVAACLSGACMNLLENYCTRVTINVSHACLLVRLTLFPLIQIPFCTGNCCTIE